MKDGRMEVWVMVMRFLKMMRGKRAKKYRKLREQTSMENNVGELSMRSAAGSTTIKTGLYPALLGTSQSPTSSMFTASSLAPSSKTTTDDSQSLNDMPVPDESAIPPPPQSSTPLPAHPTIESELKRLESLLQPHGTYNTASILRETIVGLGSLTRSIDQLMEDDPEVGECPEDVEMLVRRAGELFGHLQDFAERKGIPITSSSFRRRERDEGNPDFVFEDNASWAPPSNVRIALSDIGDEEDRESLLGSEEEPPSPTASV